MKEYNVWQRILINIALILLNVLVFSNTFIGIKVYFSGIISIIAGFIVILFSVFVFIKINFSGFLGRYCLKHLYKKDDTEIKTLNQCNTVLKAYMANNEYGFFNDGLTDLTNNIVQFAAKSNSVKKVLVKSFENTEITYKKFSATIVSAEEAIIAHIGILATRLAIFKGSAYTDKRSVLYDEFAKYLSNTMAYLDELNTKMDKLLIELTKLNTISFEKHCPSGAANELQSLADSIKWYK